jgi:uncharacterized protein (TIGR02246 family)
MDEFEARVDRLESRHALADLAAAYCTAVDAKDAKRVAEIFTIDGRLNAMSGRAAIEEFFTRWMSEYGPTFHYPHAQVIEFRGRDDAAAVVTGHAEQRRGDEVWVMGVRYVDSYRREKGLWLIADRNVGYRYRLRVEDYARLFGEVNT